MKLLQYNELNTSNWQDIIKIYCKTVSECILLKKRYYIALFSNDRVRSIPQNRFYFFVINKVAHEIGESSDSLHMKLKLMFLRVDNGKTRLKTPFEMDWECWGELPPFIDDLPYSKKLSTKEWEEYRVKCFQLITNVFGVTNIPIEPNGMTVKQWMQYYGENKIK